MKTMIVFLMAIVISLGTIAEPVFAKTYYEKVSIYSYKIHSRVLETNRLESTTFLKIGLKDGIITEQEKDMIIKTNYLFVVTDEQRKQILFEACKWALAKNIALAEDKTIPLKSRGLFIRSAKLIKKTPGLKKAFNYDDVDLSFFNGRPLYKRLKSGKRSKSGTYFYMCGQWTFDALFYGYLRIKEKEMRKAAKLWGYSFEEFTRRLSKTAGSWIVLRGKHKTKPIPPGMGIHSFSPWHGNWHFQLSLGKFGFSSNGIFVPDVSKNTQVWRKKTNNWHWYPASFMNPIIAGTYYKLVGSEIQYRWPKTPEGRKGVFHLKK